MPPRPAPPWIREAAWPHDQQVAEGLLRNYAAHLADTHAIRPHGFEQELAELPQRWSLPRGVLLLAFLSGEAAGCVALQLRPDYSVSACEMKRLWVEPSARGQRLGRLLLDAAVAWCRTHRMTDLLLDTVPAAMPEAVALYRSAGFVETERHNSNDVPGLLFMRKNLGSTEEHPEVSDDLP